MSAERFDDSLWDVVVVGASLAGCATAIHFSKMGHRVAVVEKRVTAVEHYKQLCTHFIQPHAAPLLAPLGLEHLLDPARSVMTRGLFVTPGGTIDASYGDDPSARALNLERRVLDPAIREAARRQGVRFFDRTSVEALERDGTDWLLGVRTVHGSRRVRARLVVAADGRRSRLAGLLGNTTEQRPNDRAAIFGYFTGIAALEGNRSIFIRNGKDMACVYPLVGGRTALVLFAEKSRIANWDGPDDRLAGLLAYFAGLQESPPLSGAVLDSPLLGYADYPNQIRQPVAGSVPFVGDAALSLDAMSGVGCGFALSSADLLARSFVGRSLDTGDVREGLDDYGLRFEAAFRPHVDGICADSLVQKDESTQQRVFEAICGSPGLSREYLSLTGRLSMPADFQRALMRTLMTRARSGAIA
ncbi:NAD(P)/FAD-dependent oxidoreductase [Oerskovia paurometabola]|nr:NAD(P)/FAD-dependent oxidoreductase [Oerskovia gallyi]